MTALPAVRTVCHMLADQPYLSIPEAALALDVSASSVRRWVKSGRLRSVRLPSGRKRILREDVAAILEPTGSAA